MKIFSFTHSALQPETYRAALAADEEYADAHYNLSRLLEAQGDAQGAFRHLSRFRRLMKTTRS